jgi:hypothetical protein
MQKLPYSISMADGESTAYSGEINMGKRIVVIGGVAAGPKAAARARRLDPSAEITTVEVVAYCMTSLCAWEAIRIIAGYGYDNVGILDGGLRAWPFDTHQGAGHRQMDHHLTSKRTGGTM